MHAQCFFPPKFQLDVKYCCFLVQLKEYVMREISFSFSKWYRYDPGDRTTNWQLNTDLVTISS